MPIAKALPPPLIFCTAAADHAPATLLSTEQPVPPDQGSLICCNSEICLPILAIDDAALSAVAAGEAPVGVNIDLPPGEYMWLA